MIRCIMVGINKRKGKKVKARRRKIKPLNTRLLT